MFIFTHSISVSGLVNEHKGGVMRAITSLPISVKKGLSKLGQDISDARKRRRIPTTLMAERAGISRTTLNKVEKGDASVALGIYASVLFVLGMEKRLSELADSKFDETGLMLDEENLPERIHLKRSKKKDKK